MPPPTPPKAALDLIRPRSVQGLRTLTQNPVIATALVDSTPGVNASLSRRFVQAMLTEVSVNPSLADCTPISLLTCVARSAQLGLMLGGPAGQAFLVGYWNNQVNRREAQLQIGYKGYVQMATRTGQVKRITPVTVREGDDFRYGKGTSPFIHHLPPSNPELAKLGEFRPAIAFYAVIELVNGGVDFETFTADDAKRFRDRFSAGRKNRNGPWYDETIGGTWERMSEKTLIRRLAKRIPLSDSWNQAAILDDQSEHDQVQSLPELDDGFLERVSQPDPDEAMDAEVVREDSADGLGRD